MIENFEAVKKQLEELSPVINSFKSEAVQLEILSLIFKKGGAAASQARQEKIVAEQGKKKPTQKKKKTSAKPDAKKAQKSPGDGPVATLSKLYEEGFFKDPQTITTIIAYCKHNMAKQFKSTDLSGKLGRMTRDGHLKRVKNSENQYEYRAK